MVLILQHLIRSQELTKTTKSTLNKTTGHDHENRDMDMGISSKRMLKLPMSLKSPNKQYIPCPLDNKEITNWNSLQVNSLYDTDPPSDWRVDRGWLLFDEAGLLLRCYRHLCLHRHSLPSLADFVSGDGYEKNTMMIIFVTGTSTLTMSHKRDFSPLWPALTLSSFSLFPPFRSSGVRTHRCQPHHEDNGPSFWTHQLHLWKYLFLKRFHASWQSRFFNTFSSLRPPSSC